MGACPVPKVKGRWLGNLDVLRMMMENWKNGYPGMFLPPFILALFIFYVDQVTVYGR
jgi:hypothetical protein